MSLLYLAAILVSTAGMAVVDYRWRLFAFARPALAAAVVACGAGFFLIWDVVAISLGIYERGRSPAMTGVEIAAELPLEEVFFVVFLSYLTMVVHGLVLRVLEQRGIRDDRERRWVAR